MMKNTVLISVLYSSLLVASAAQTKESAAGEPTSVPNKTLLALCSSKDGMRVTFPHAILYPDRLELKVSNQSYIISLNQSIIPCNALTPDLSAALLLIHQDIERYNTKRKYKTGKEGLFYSVNPNRLSVEMLPKEAVIKKKAGADETIES